ncbi:MAG TPA: hypothetical protein VL098_15275 [Flavipsychrobacter sp.]|nr:hypothetical protein [Flavipsychrobacter sp.]
MATKEEIVQKLTKFRLVDKYHAFHEVMPHAFHADAGQRSVTTEILDNCAKELVFLFNTAKKKPAKALIKKVLQLHMELIAHSVLDEANKEFAYRLCWFLAEKAETSLSKQTAKKYWGYWQVVNDEVQVIKYRKPRKKMQ